MPVWTTTTTCALPEKRESQNGRAAAATANSTPFITGRKWPVHHIHPML
jgi:hypothetical protein